LRRVDLPERQRDGLVRIALAGEEPDTAADRVLDPLVEGGVGARVRDADGDRLDLALVEGAGVGEADLRFLKTIWRSLCCVDLSDHLLRAGTYTGLV
jgi:hypothetical protein